MNAQELRAPRGILRRKASIDLNEAPGDQEGNSASVDAAPTVIIGGNLQARFLPSQPVPAMIDVDAIEDDVVESSASDFAEVNNPFSYCSDGSRLCLCKKVNRFCFGFDARL